MGRALEVLIQGLGYNTRLIEESGAGKPEELLRGIQLLLVVPTVSTESRERLLAGMRSTPGSAAIPVLTLSTVPKKELADQTGLVPWPCRLEDLKTEIEAALITAGGAEGPAGRGSQFIPGQLEAPSRPADPLSFTAEPSVAKGGTVGGSFSSPVAFGSDL